MIVSRLPPQSILDQFISHRIGFEIFWTQQIDVAKKSVETGRDGPDVRHERSGDRWYFISSCAFLYLRYIPNRIMGSDRLSLAPSHKTLVFFGCSR